jgi:hypothetical protein
MSSLKDVSQTDAVDLSTLIADVGCELEQARCRATREVASRNTGLRANVDEKRSSLKLERPR